MCLQSETVTVIKVILYNAGANIIQENMRLGDALQVNSDVAGKVVHAIFGFCDIRNFTDCTEVQKHFSCISILIPLVFR